jgi:hypothetical protein
MITTPLDDLEPGSRIVVELVGQRKRINAVFDRYYKKNGAWFFVFTDYKGKSYEYSRDCIRFLTSQD